MLHLTKWRPQLQLQLQTRRGRGQGVCVCVCEATWRWYKIKFQLLTNIYALLDKSGIKLWRRAAQTVQSAKCEVQSAE